MKLNLKSFFYFMFFPITFMKWVWKHETLSLKAKSAITCVFVAILIAVGVTSSDTAAAPVTDSQSNEIQEATSSTVEPVEIIAKATEPLTEAQTDAQSESTTEIVPTESPTSENDLFNNKAMTKAVIDRVVDGDTFVLDTGEKVRLILIDTPESVHPDEARNSEYGKMASEYATALLLGKTVYLETDVSNTDRYGRLLRYAYLEDGTFINEKIVKDGYANISTYPPDVKYKDTILEAERYAREHNLGLWALAVEETTVVSTESSTANLLTVSGLVGSLESDKFHFVTCRWAKKILEVNLIEFSSKEDAINQGYVPCGVCKP